MTARALYQSHADLGGQPGHGRVQPEPEGQLFHQPWEPQVLALTLAMGATGSWNLDQSRAARETRPQYAQLSYYELWLESLQHLLAERGLVLPDEIAAGRALQAPRPVARVLAATDVAAALARGSPTARPAAQGGAQARFAVGDAVRTDAAPRPHHTRLPAYVRGKRGTIERVHGPHVLADAHAQGLGEQPQWLYTVVFDGRELFGPDAEPGLRVSVDAWDDYLHPHPAAP